MRSKTNETTNEILNFLFRNGIFAWRANVLPVPIIKNGVLTGFRPGSKAGVPDIVAILRPDGKFCGIEIKTGKDKLREAQIGFHITARNMGALILVVKDYEDFLAQWKNLIHT